VVATKRAEYCDQAGGLAVATKRALLRKCVLLAGYGWWLLGVEPKQASDSAIPVALGNRFGCDQTGGESSVTGCERGFHGVSCDQTGGYRRIDDVT